MESKALGARIRRRREELGMTQEELAKKVGWASKGSVNKVELGKIGVPKSKIGALAKALQMDESELTAITISGEYAGFQYCVDRQMNLLGYNVTCDEDANVILNHGRRHTELQAGDLDEVYDTVETALIVALTRIEKKNRSYVDRNEKK